MACRRSKQFPHGIRIQIEIDSINDAMQCATANGVKLLREDLKVFFSQI